MNVETLNIVNLDDTSATYKAISNSGGGGGNSGGGSNGGDGVFGEMPYKGDGNIYLYVDIASTQSEVTILANNSVWGSDSTIDWGDGTSNSLSTNKHTYEKIGCYIICITNNTPSNRIEIGNTNISILAASSGYAISSKDGILVAAEFGERTKFVGAAFYNCFSMEKLIITAHTSINSRCFYNCYNLKEIIVKGSNKDFAIKGTADKPVFSGNLKLKMLDLSEMEFVPPISVAAAVNVVVPDALYDEWIVATNWATYPNKIIKKSDWDSRVLKK